MILYNLGLGEVLFDFEEANPVEASQLILQVRFRDALVQKDCLNNLATLLKIKLRASGDLDS